MPCMVTSNDRRIFMRDGVGLDAPVFRLDPGKPVPFKHLPRGHSEEGDSEVRIQKISDEEFKKAESKRKSTKEMRSERRAAGKLTAAEKDQQKELAKIAESKTHPKKAEAEAKLKDYGPKPKKKKSED